MTDTVKQLVAALREELQCYGALLAVLDRQQDLVFTRSAQELHDTVGEVHQLSTVLHDARALRDRRRQELCRELSMPPETPFGILVPLLAADLQPLVQALVQENNELLVRVQQRARQNHLLLSRSVELMQQFIGSLLPGPETTTYSETGRGRCGTLPSSSVYDAVG